jgi:hypothetical protein
VHYLGESEAATPFPHGNRKHGNQPFVRSAPSTIRSIKQQVATQDSVPVYRSMVDKPCPGEHQGDLNPHDKKQVRNCKYLESKNQKLPHDELYNTLLLAYHLNDFVWHATFIPDLDIVVGSPMVVDHFENLL